MWLLYQIAFALVLLVAGPFLLLVRGRHYLATVKTRLGLLPPADGERPLWLHAVSVGEVGVAATVARALPSDTPLLVTTITPTGQSLAREAFRDRATVTYLPFDLGFAVGRFFRRFRPAALVLAEGDLWPLVLRRARREGLPVTVVNGRVSDGSFRRMARLKPLLGPLLSGVDRFAVQTAADSERLVRLGVPAARVVETGNLKFEIEEPAPLPELEGRIRDLAAGRPLLVAGSTMAGEEAAVLDAFAGCGGGERALLLLAPRHPERFREVDALLAARGVPRVRRSRLEAAPGAAVLLLDSLGELSALYRLAAAAFIGGTLVPTGGHNPLEAARFGVPVAVGPSMENFRGMAAAFDRAEAWARVADAGELARVWDRWLGDPRAASRLGARGAELVAAHRGALARTLEVLQPLLEARARAAADGRGEPAP